MSQSLLLGKGESQTTSNLYLVNQSSNATTSIGASGFGLTGLAEDPISGILYGSTNSNSAAHPKSLITLNTSTGAGTFVAAFSPATAVPDIDFDSSGQLYGISSAKTLYRINKTTGALTSVGATGLPVPNLGIKKSSGVGYSIDYDNKVYSLNLSTGAKTLLGTTTTLFVDGAGESPNAVAIDSSGVLWCITDDAGGTGNLYSVDLGSLALTHHGATYATGFDADALGFATSSDTTPPSLLSIAANTAGTQLTLTYDEALAGSALTSEYVVTVNGSAVTVSAASIVGSTVLLTVSPVVRSGDVVLVSYTA